MQSNPLVSIIIPTYNRAHLISETLDSVLMQTYENWECIIVDDGSIDNSAEIIGNYVNKDTRFQYHHRPKDRPKGANTCRNYGFELSKGSYITWFDDDDIMHLEKIEKQVNSLEKSDFNFSICQTLLFSERIENANKLLHNSILSRNPFEDFLQRKIVWLTQAPLFNKKFLLRMDYLFDEELQAAQEWEFFCRVLWLENRYAVLDEALVFNRQHEGRLGVVKEFENKRLYHYYLARVKIENFLYEKKSEELYFDFFIKYYLQIFRHLILNKNKVISNLIFNQKLKKRLSFYKIIKLQLVSILYLNTGKGYGLLKKVSS